MVVPVRMRRTPTVTMEMGVAREHGRIATQRRIERVMGRVPLVVVCVPMDKIVIVAVSIIMLGERGLKNMRSASMFQRNDDTEFVRLGYFFDGLPVRSVICKEKNLALPLGA